jgi:F-type H+-transporting ATPase subunit b
LILLPLFHVIFANFVPEWLEPWLDYPGLELWKFVNLLIFLVLGFLLHRRFGRPIQEAFRSRSEGIKRELASARAERDQALTKLAEVETLFSTLDSELVKIKEQARLEADAERRRMEAATEQEVAKIKEQAKREIESAGKAARQDLRKFAANESVRLAEEILKREIRPEDDARMTTLNVQQLGGTRA